MTISRTKKESILKSLIDSFDGAKSVIFAKNNGLTVEETRGLKSGLRENNVSFRVAKKTLFKIAAEKTGIESFDIKLLDGAVGAAISSGDEVMGAKLLGKYAKDNEKLELVAGIVDGKVLTKNEVINLSLLPSKEELYGKMLGSMQAPLSGFVGISNNLIGGFVRCLDQIKDQKDSA